jgi:hypothetical protein
LRDLGHVDGKKIFEFRWAEALRSLPKLAAELNCPRLTSFWLAETGRPCGQTATTIIRLP